MSKDTVEALTANDDVYLSTPMTPYEHKNSTPIPGEDKFNTLLVSPISSKPLKTVLTFSGNSLKSIYITLEDASRMLDEVKELITSKYGEPKVENSMKEEQCLYKNGANFKLSSGAIRYQWTQERPTAEKVEATLSDIVVDTCPSNLRYSMGAFKLRNLSIGVALPKSEKKQVNPF